MTERGTSSTTRQARRSSCSQLANDGPGYSTNHLISATHSSTTASDAGATPTSGAGVLAGTPSRDISDNLTNAFRTGTSACSAVEQRLRHCRQYVQRSVVVRPARKVRAVVVPVLQRLELGELHELRRDERLVDARQAFIAEFRMDPDSNGPVGAARWTRRGRARSRFVPGVQERRGWR